MKKIAGFIFIIALVLIFDSCKDSVKTISESELIELIKNDKVANVNAENGKEAFVFLEKGSKKPDFKVDIESGSNFIPKMFQLQTEHHFSFKPTSFVELRPHSTLLSFISLYLFGLLFYILGGIVCLIIILKNKFKDPIDKLAWVVTVIFVPVIGIILFALIGWKQIKRAE